MAIEATADTPAPMIGLAPDAPAAVRRPAASRRRAKGRKETSLARTIETANEVLWALLLSLVIGFLVAKAPALSALLDEVTSVSHRAAVDDADRASAEQLQEITTRMVSYEKKLGPLEHGYAQLRHRNAELQKAYDALKARTR
jgi:hypothetical protein